MEGKRAFPEEAGESAVLQYGRRRELRVVDAVVGTAEMQNRMEE